MKTIVIHVQLRKTGRGRSQKSYLLNNISTCIATVQLICTYIKFLVNKNQIKIQLNLI